MVTKELTKRLGISRQSLRRRIKELNEFPGWKHVIVAGRTTIDVPLKSVERFERTHERKPGGYWKLKKKQ